VHDLVDHRRVQHKSSDKISPQTRKRKAAENSSTEAAPPAKKQQASATDPPTPATTGIMDTEDEFMSGMSESEADGEFDFQVGDSEDDVDMGSDEGMLIYNLPHIHY